MGWGWCGDLPGCRAAAGAGENGPFQSSSEPGPSAARPGEDGVSGGSLKPVINGVWG